MAALAVEVRGASGGRSPTGLVMSLVMGLVMGLAALACARDVQAGGVILERAQAASGASCRQGGVEWLGSGGKACPMAVRVPGGEAATASAVASRAAGAAPARSNDEGRRQILQQELSQERARLAALELSGREPGRQPGAAEALQRARQDVIALERELARLAP